MRKVTLLTATLLISILGLSQGYNPYLAGRACMSQELYDSAVIHLADALELKPGDTDILYHLGISYFALRKYPAAKDAFYETEKRRKGMGSLYLARTEVKLNHPEQALNYLRIHLGSRFKVAESAILLDEDLATLEGSAGWQQLWNEKKWYSSGDKAYREALFLQENGDYLEAINQLNKLEKQGYKRTIIQSVKSDLYAKLGNMKASRSEIRSAVKSDIRNLDAVQQLALFQMEDGDVEEAIIGLNRVIKMDPARFDAYVQRAEALGQKGDLEGAIQDMDLYLSYFPGDDEALYRKGMIQYRNRKYLDAIQSFNHALELDKGKSEYYFARGMTYASTGTTRYAEKDMSMALDLDPLNGEIWFEKGKLSEKLGNHSAACSCYQKAYQYGIYEAGELHERFCN